LQLYASLLLSANFVWRQARNIGVEFSNSPIFETPAANRMTAGFFMGSILFEEIANGRIQAPGSFGIHGMGCPASQ
jgi:hypothetical protein